MTGDEEAADAAVEEAFNAALEGVDAARSFPCHRSWIFAKLLEALKRSYSSAAPDIGSVGWISLLQIPPEERAVLVLHDGLGFDLPTAAVITGHVVQEVERLLTQARRAFKELSTTYRPEPGHYLQ